MKLFQKLLLGPAVIGLLTPIASNASDTNFSDVNSYSQNDVEVSLDSFKPLSNEKSTFSRWRGFI